MARLTSTRMVELLAISVLVARTHEFAILLLVTGLQDAYSLLLAADPYARQLVVNAVTLFIPLAIVLLTLRVHRVSLPHLGFTSPTKTDLRLSLAYFPLLFPAAFLARVLTPEFDAWYAPQLGIGSATSLIAMLPAIAIGVLREELFERSLLQGPLSRAYGSAVAVAAISLHFALIHYVSFPGSLLYSLLIAATVLLGTPVIAALYERTRSLTAPVLLHLLYNVVVVFQIYLHVTDARLAESLLWLLWAGAFLAILSLHGTAIKDSLTTTRTLPRLTPADALFLLLFAFLVPLAAVNLG